MEKIIKTDDEWRAILTPEEFAVTREKGTEKQCSGPFWKHQDEGVYRCICCGLDLFESTHKFESKSGWPSFFAPISEDHISQHTDTSYGMRRTEVLCARCDAHLGHVFEDGPRPTGLRFCINSIALQFILKNPNSK